MILKQADDKTTYIAELERLKAIAPPDRTDKINRELSLLRAGLKGEQEASYLIDFYLEKSTNTVVIHDLRLNIGGRIAQIDHVLLHRTLNVFVLETKHFHAGLKITEDGEFLRWNSYKKTYEGMSSPLAQNERHIVVLNDAFASIGMPTRLGMRLSPVFHSYILVSPDARIIRPEKFDTTQVIKADALDKTLDMKFEKTGFIATLGNASRFISPETLQDIGRKLVALHQPADFNYAAKFGIQELENTFHTPQCRSCGSRELSILHGRFGYYFKCSACDANTPIKIGCGKPGHKERVHKDGRHFYRECLHCGSNTLFFTNPT